MNNVSFSKQLIKGKVAEHVFEQMLRDSGNFTVLSFGYENVLPELAHQQDTIVKRETMETIRTAPDYVVINRTTKEVNLIEVKYRTSLNIEDVLKLAKRMLESWRTAHLFIATPDGFYSDEVEKIVNEKGVITPLNHKQIPKELQESYIKLLMEFMDGVNHN